MSITCSGAERHEWHLQGQDMSHTASKNPSLSYPQRTLATKAIILLSVLIPLCDAQLLLDPSDGLAFVPPGTRLSQALQQVWSSCLFIL